MGHVEGHVGKRDFRFEIDGIITLFLVFQKHWSRGQLKRLGFIICLTVDQCQNPDLVVILIDLILFVDIGKLVPLGVNNMEIRIGYEVTAFRGVSDVNMTFERWNDIGRKLCHFVRSIQKRGRRIGPI